MFIGDEVELTLSYNTSKPLVVARPAAARQLIMAAVEPIASAVRLLISGHGGISLRVISSM